MTQTEKYPKTLLAPIEEFLESQLKYLKLRKKTIQKEDPYFRVNRTGVKDADEPFKHDKAIAVKEELEIKIRQTKRALRGIKKGDYGFCENCGELINTDRLAIYPEATLCIKCSTNLK